MTEVKAVLVDTDVYSLLFVRQGSSDPRVELGQTLLGGRRVVISFQTRAEVLGGAMSRGWGAERLGRLRADLEATPTIRADDAVIHAHAVLVAECRRRGHGLQDKRHSGDRWAAACAIAKDLALLAGDGVYDNAPRLTLLG